MSENEAFLAMYAFLEEYYCRGKSDEIANLLSGLSLLQDGIMADAAMQEDWLDAVAKAKSGKVNASLYLS